MRDRIARYRLIRAIVTALNRLPDTFARGASVYEFSLTDEPDVIASVRGRAVVFAVAPPRVLVSRARLERLDLWQSRGAARAIVVDSVAGALMYADEVAEAAQAETDPALLAERVY